MVHNDDHRSFRGHCVDEPIKPNKIENKKIKSQRTDINLPIIIDDPTPDIVGTTSRDHTRR